MLIINYLFAFFLFSGATSHELYMSVCEMEKASNGKLEIRFYLFHDDLKQALYSNPNAAEINPEDAQKYIDENTELILNDNVTEFHFQNLDYHNGQVRITCQINFPPGQKIKRIELTNRLLVEHFRTQTNMVYFVKNDGERLVQMLDGNKTIAKFEL